MTPRFMIVSVALAAGMGAAALPVAAQSQAQDQQVPVLRSEDEHDVTCHDCFDPRTLDRYVAGGRGRSGRRQR